MSDCNNLEVDCNSHGCRLDKFIANQLGCVSRTKAQQMIESRFVFIGNKAVLANDIRVKQGEIYTILLESKLAKSAEDLALLDINLDIVYEDEDILVINKQSNLVVHPGAGNNTNTLVNALMYRYGDKIVNVGNAERPGIVHRLDKDTSGLMVVAKTNLAYHNLVSQISKREVRRKYIAITKGLVCPVDGVIDVAIARHKFKRQKMQAVREGGRNAVTYYRVKQVLANGSASVVECDLLTGRTHQIRVHLAHLGNPIIGDKKYSRRSTFNMARHALHAAHINFYHPVSGKVLEFESSIPEDMKSLISIIEIDM